MRPANETTVEILRDDPQLRQIHLAEAIDTLFTEDRRVALLMLRDIINASIGFKALAVKVGKSDKSLMGMLTGESNPTLESISRIVKALVEHENMVPRTKLKKA